MAFVTWNSVPDYDAWGFDEYWSCPEWESWYYALKTHFGVDTAKYIWSYAWNKQTMGAHALDCRSFNDQFKAFLKKEDLTSAANNPISKLTAGIGDIFSATGDALSGAGKGLSMLKYIIPALLLVAVAILVFVVLRTSKNITNA